MCVTLRPFRRIVPRVGVSNPAIMRSTVVLPQPDGPRNVMNSPCSIVMSNRCSATFGPNVL